MPPIPPSALRDSPVMRVLAFCAACLLAACGGKVEREPGSGSSGGGTAGAAGGSGGFPSTPLGECHPGQPYEPNADEPCPFIAEGLCYESKLAACACVCPTDHESWCSSGYPEPGGQPVVVTCD